jgi:uncharacterized protein YndB with AHSA1/START domain
VCDRELAGPKHGTRYDPTDASLSVVGAGTSVRLAKRTTTTLFVV